MKTPEKLPDFSGMLRWPNVPACYGWLSLDRRGQWRMRGEPVTHAGLANFLNRQQPAPKIQSTFCRNRVRQIVSFAKFTDLMINVIAGVIHAF